MKVIDIANMKFGKLKVIEREKPHRFPVKWKCLCDCGNICFINSYLIRKGRSKSCGCSKFGGPVPMTVAAMNSCYSKYKKGAKDRDLMFDLSLPQFLNITQKSCFYCMAPPSNIIRSQYKKGDFVYNGIDRMDNKKGYVISNVVPCCKSCNLAKGRKTLKEWSSYLDNLTITRAKMMLAFKKDEAK